MQYLLKQLEKFSFPQVTFPIPNRGQHLPATKFEVRKHNSVTAGTHGAADLLWSTLFIIDPHKLTLQSLDGNQRRRYGILGATGQVMEATLIQSNAFLTAFSG